MLPRVSRDAHGVPIAKVGSINFVDLSYIDCEIRSFGTMGPFSGSDYQ